MNNQRLYTLLFLLTFIVCYPLSSFSQHSVDTTAYLSKAGLTRFLNLRFGSIVTGQSNSTAIGSYASFDPANGSFTFKGSFGVGRQDSAQISYLTFKLEGDLISDSYAALFSNSKLNTGGAIEAQYHIRLKKNGIVYSFNDRSKVHLDTLMAGIDQRGKVNALFQADANRKSQIQENRFQLAQASYEITINKFKLDSVSQIRQAALNAQDSAALKKSNAFADSIGTLITKGEATILQLNKAKDSLDFVDTNDLELRNAQKKVIIDAYNQKIVQIETAAPYRRMKLYWLTFIGGVSKKNFYTFNSTLPFESQLSQQELSTFRVGLAYNFYQENNATKRARLFNLGFLRYKDNNTSLLTTRQISQDAVFKNTDGDTTRKVSKTYNAYTDTIVESQVWSLFANWYFIQKGKSRSFHLYPSVDIHDHGKTLSNIGLGYIVSFKNEKKDQPVINVEGYVQFQDLFNEQDKKAGFWNRNEIGIRITLPFNFF